MTGPAEHIRERIEEIERVRTESMALGLLSEERNNALFEVMEGLEEDRGMLEGLVSAYAGSDDPDVVHTLSFLLAGAANIESQASWVPSLVLRAVRELRVTYPWPRLNLCTAVLRIGFLAGLWDDKVAHLPTSEDKKAIARLIDEGLDGPPAVRSTAAQLFVSLSLPGSIGRFDPQDEEHLRVKLLGLDGTIPEDVLTQNEIDILKRHLARREALHTLRSRTGLWNGDPAEPPSEAERQAIVRLIEEGLDGPPSMRCMAARALFSIYGSRDRGRLAKEDEERLCEKLLHLDGAHPDDRCTQVEIEALKSLREYDEHRESESAQAGSTPRVDE